MKVIYDPEVDVLSVLLSDKQVAESDAEKPGLVLDYDLKAVSIVLCKRLSADRCYPATLVAPERRVGLRGDATRAPTQGPGFGAGGRSSFRAGPAILAIMR